jgi:hypothetical protein
MIYVNMQLDGTDEVSMAAPFCTICYILKFEKHLMVLKTSLTIIQPSDKCW